MSAPTDFLWILRPVAPLAHPPLPPSKRATNFYVWDSKEAAENFFSKELRERVTSLYGVAPTVDFVQIAQVVDNTRT